MKSISSVATAVLFTVVFGGPCLPQSAAPTTAAAGNQGELIQSTLLLAELTHTLNGKKLKPGSAVHAEISQDVLSHGRIIIPVDSKLQGHVTEVQPRGGDQASRLGIVFDSIILKHRERKLQGVVYALAAPVDRRSRIDEPDLQQPPAFMSGAGSTPGSGGTSTTNMSGRSSGRRGGTGAMMPSGPPIHSDSALLPTANASRSAGGAPMSLGLGRPSGVFGIKGVGLGHTPSAETPGPVILSTAKHVRLEFGTQVIIKIADARDLPE